MAQKTDFFKWYRCYSLWGGSRDLLECFRSGIGNLTIAPNFEQYMTGLLDQFYTSQLPSTIYRTPYQIVRIVRICPPIIVNFNPCNLPSDELCHKIDLYDIYRYKWIFRQNYPTSPANCQVRYICPYFDDLLWIHFILNQTVCLLKYLFKHCCTWSRDDF